MTDTDNPMVMAASAIAEQAGSTALVRGWYVELDVRKAKTGEAVLAGHAGIRLTDDTIVLLASPWADEALRSPEERNQLRDKEVIAEGTLHAVCPSSAGASLQMPCLSPLLYVVTPEIHALLHDDRR